MKKNHATFFARLLAAMNMAVSLMMLTHGARAAVNCGNIPACSTGCGGQQCHGCVQDGYCENYYCLPPHNCGGGGQDSCTKYKTTQVTYWCEGNTVFCHGEWESDLINLGVCCPCC